MAITRGDITGVVLSGGNARRMGGMEKPLQLLHGTPLVQHVCERLAPQVSRVIVSANRDRDRYAQFADAVIADDIPDRGPLGGLASALRFVTTPYVACVPGDAPLLEPALISRLANTLGSANADVCMPHDGARTQQLFLLMRTQLRNSIVEYLDDGGRSVLGWLDSRNLVVLDASDIAHSFLNINTEQELLLAQGLNQMAYPSPVSERL